MELLRVSIEDGLAEVGSNGKRSPSASSSRSGARSGPGGTFRTWRSTV